MEKIKLIRELKRIQNILKDYNKFKYLFSDDKGKKTLAELYKLTLDIEFLLSAFEGKSVNHPKKNCFEPGIVSPVRIRPCGKEYGNKTYFGLLIGDIPLSSSISIKRAELNLEWAHYNPAIFVPDLKKIIFGCESWWNIIEKPEEMETISDSDIENAWYMKLLKEWAVADTNQAKEEAESL